MSEITEGVKKYLSGAGFEMALARGPFAYVAQNSVSLVFITPCGSDIESDFRRVLNALSGPFHTKRFGPKTMEMYCVFLSEEPLPLSVIQRCEQDIRICRKIVVTSVGEIDEKLSFMRPLDESTIETADAGTVFWSNLEGWLRPHEVEFLRKIEKATGLTEAAIALGRKSR